MTKNLIFYPIFYHKLFFEDPPKNPHHFSVLLKVNLHHRIHTSIDHGTGRLHLHIFLPFFCFQIEYQNYFIFKFNNKTKNMSK
jgi:hypothetical protein